MRKNKNAAEESDREPDHIGHDRIPAHLVLPLRLVTRESGSKCKSCAENAVHTNSLCGS